MEDVLWTARQGQGYISFGFVCRHRSVLREATEAMLTKRIIPCLGVRARKLDR